MEVYCCASDDISVKFKTKSKYEQTNEVRKAMKACEFYLNDKKDLLEAQVLAGTEAYIQNYPHMVKLFALTYFLNKMYYCANSAL